MKWLEISYNTNANKQKKVFQGRPNWIKTVTNISNWHKAHEDIEFFVNTEDINSNTKRVYVQYGQDTSFWARAVFYKYDITIEELEKLENNSVKVKLTIKPLQVQGHKRNGITSGITAHYDFYLFGQKFYSFTNQTNENFGHDFSESDVYEDTITIKPQEQSLASAIKVVTTYPQGQYGTRTFYAGFALKNTLTANYVPMSVRKNNKWRALNNNPKGFIKIRKGNRWQDKSEEQNGTSMQVNKGKNRIRRSGEWRQLPPMN